MKLGHLERMNLTVHTLSPVFIGSGERLSKKEYILDPKKGIIYFPDLVRLMAYLQQRRLLEEYESFLIQTRQNDLRAFLLNNKINETDYHHFIRYTISAGEAVKTENFREVLTFVKDIDGRPYIPGSSIKGAIRTALAAQLMKKIDGKRMQKSILNADHSQSPRKYLSWENNHMEQELFCSLDISDPTNKSDLSRRPINDFMRGIQISDSAPLAYDQLTLTGKIDRKPDGTISPLPIFRECLIPDTEAHLLITLDMPILKKAGWDLPGIENALHKFADDHYAHFEQYYPELADDASIAAQHGVDLILGGGSGYVSKTLVYNLFADRKESLSMVAKIMHKQFRNHGHMKDMNSYKVSPHTLKTAKYREQYYQMGRCELIIT